MTEAILLGIAIAGLVITVVGGLIGLAFRMGNLSGDVKENTKDIGQAQKDIDDIRKEFVLDLKELRRDFAAGEKDIMVKMDKILVTMSDICGRIGKTEQRLDDKNGGS